MSDEARIFGRSCLSNARNKNIIQNDSRLYDLTLERDLR